MLLVTILMRMLRQATQTRFTIEIIHVNFIPNIQRVSPSSSPPPPVLTSNTSETSTIHIGFNTYQTRRSCWKVIIIINYIERININGLIYLNLICEIFTLSHMNTEKKNIPYKELGRRRRAAARWKRKREERGIGGERLRLKTWIHHHFKLVFYDFEKINISYKIYWRWASE